MQHNPKNVYFIENTREENKIIAELEQLRTTAKHYYFAGLQEMVTSIKIIKKKDVFK